MAKQKQDGQLEHTYSSYVRIQDVALKTCQRRWMIGRSGERGSGISVLAVRHDDDDIVNWVTDVEGKQKAPFSIATTLRIFSIDVENWEKMTENWSVWRKVLKHLKFREKTLMRHHDNKQTQADLTQVIPQQPLGNLCQFCDNVCGFTADLRSHVTWVLITF